MQSKFHILVGEDNDINRELMREILLLSNCMPEMAEDGKAVLDFFWKKKYDLLFLDIQMPEKDGLEVTRAIRLKDQQTPIIGLTASAFSEDHERCLAAGMNEVVSKPFELRDIESVLKKYLKV